MRAAKKSKPSKRRFYRIPLKIRQIIQNNKVIFRVSYEENELGNGNSPFDNSLFSSHPYISHVAFRQRVDLVAPNYYEKELVYQKEIEKQKNTAEMQRPVEIESLPGNVKISFPAGALSSDFRGSVRLYYPADSRNDREIDLHPDSSGVCNISTLGKISGNWRAILNWKTGGKEYSLDKGIVVVR